MNKGVGKIEGEKTCALVEMGWFVSRGRCPEMAVRARMGSLGKDSGKVARGRHGGAHVSLEAIA